MNPWSMLVGLSFMVIGMVVFAQLMKPGSTSSPNTLGPTSPITQARAASDELELSKVSVQVQSFIAQEGENYDEFGNPQPLTEEALVQKLGERDREHQYFPHRGSRMASGPGEVSVSLNNQILIWCIRGAMSTCRGFRTSYPEGMVTKSNAHEGMARQEIAVELN